MFSKCVDIKQLNGQMKQGKQRGKQRKEVVTTLRDNDIETVISQSDRTR